MVTAIGIGVKLGKAVTWFIKGGWKKILALVILAAIAYGIVMGVMRIYDHIYDRGAAAQLKLDTVAITKLQKDLADKTEDLRKFKQDYGDWISAGERVNGEVDVGQKELMAELRLKLLASEQKVKEKEQLLNEIRKQIGASDDVASPGTAGFARLYNQSLEKPKPAAKPAAGN